MKWLSLVAASGCGSADVAGAWSGDCDVQSFGFDQTYGIEMDLAADDGKTITGTGSIDDGIGVYALSAAGELKGRRLVLTLEPNVVVTTTGGVVDVSYGIDGKVKADELAGDCSVKAMGVTVNGALVMLRQ